MPSTRTKLVALVALVAAALSPAWAQKKPAPAPAPKDPLEIVEWAIKAHGGEAKLAKTSVMNRRLYCAVDVPDVGMVPFYLDNLWILPDKFRVRFQMPMGSGQWAWRETVYNNGKAWQSLMGQEKELTSSDLNAVKEQIFVESLCQLLPLRETRIELAPLDEIELEKRPLVGISAQCKGYKPVNLYFDKQTGLLTKMQYPVVGADSKHTNQEVYFREYRDFSGLKYWRRLTVVTDGGHSFEAELVDVKFPDKIRDEYFELPKDKSDKNKGKDKK